MPGVRFPSFQANPASELLLFDSESWRKAVLRKKKLVTLVLMLGVVPAALADQITLKNGDHLTGKVVKSDGKTLVLHTEFAGDVTLKFDAITQITTDEELHVTTADKKSAVGPVTTRDGKIEVATKTGGTVEVAPGNVAVIRNDAEQAAYDKTLHPGLLHGWNGGVNVGFSLARGNSQTSNLALAVNAVHPTLHDKTTIYLTSIDTKNDLATPSTVANLITSGLRYDRNVSAKLFGFVGADFMSNQLQNLDLRGAYGGGLGFHAIKSESTILDFLAGVNYTHETYSNGAEVLPLTVPPTFVSYGVTHRFMAITLGEELMHKAGKSTVITERLYFFPNMSNTGQYRGTFDLGAVTKISKWLGWQNQFSDIYVSNPPAGAKKNDLIFTTGLNFSFTH
jgi:putative salt-induced outer membrane protein